MTANPFAAMLRDVPRYDGYWTFDPDGDVVRLSDVLAALAAAVPADLAEAGKVLEGVTPRPWRHGVRKDGSIWLSLGDPVSGPHYQGDLWAGEPDARFIAWCREGVPALLARIAAQEAQIATMIDSATVQKMLEDAQPIMAEACRGYEETIAAQEAQIKGLEAEITATDDLMAADSCRIAALDDALAAERAKVARLVEAGKALGLREIVAGWNGEGKEKAYTPHPAHLWATIKTTCGAVYALDAAITEAGPTEYERKVAQMKEDFPNGI